MENNESVTKDESWIELETDRKFNTIMVENQGDYLCIGIDDEYSGCQYLEYEQAIRLQEWFSKQTFKKKS